MNSPFVTILDYPWIVPVGAGAAADRRGGSIHAFDAINHPFTTGG